MAKIEHLAQSILDFWFGELDQKGIAPPDKKENWFKKSPEFDGTIKRLFGSHLETAYMGALDLWTQTVEGTSALIVLCDQFPRNIYRGKPKSFQWDKKALTICKEAIQRQDHLKAKASYASFMMMPTMHSEDLESQELGITQFKKLLAAHHGSAKSMFENTLAYAIVHRDIIKRFGRFPHRNEILGRPSTSEEAAFLKKEGSSF